MVLLQLIVQLIFGVVELVLMLIPDITFDGNFFLALKSVHDVMDGASYLIPFGTFFACISVFFLLHNVTLIISIFNWILRKIPGVA